MSIPDGGAFLLRRKPVVRGVVERRGYHEHRPRGDQRAGDESSDDLPLRPGERDGKAVGNRRRLLREEGGGDGEYVEAAVESNGSAGGGGGLTKRDVGDGSGAGEDADAHVLAAAELRDGIDDVVSSGNFENVGAHSGFGVSGYDNGWLGLVFGTRRTTSRTPHDLNGGAVAPAGGVGLLSGCGCSGGFLGGELERVVLEGVRLKL